MLETVLTTLLSGLLLRSPRKLVSIAVKSSAALTARASVCSFGTALVTASCLIGSVALKAQEVEGLVWFLTSRWLLMV